MDSGTIGLGAAVLEVVAAGAGAVACFSAGEPAAFFFAATPIEAGAALAAGLLGTTAACMTGGFDFEADAGFAPTWVFEAETASGPAAGADFGTDGAVLTACTSGFGVTAGFVASGAGASVRCGGFGLDAVAAFSWKDALTAVPGGGTAFCPPTQAVREFG